MLPFSITSTSYSAPSARSTTSASITMEAIVPASLKQGKKAEIWRLARSGLPAGARAL